MPSELIKEEWYGVMQNKMRRGDEDFLILTKDMKKALDVLNKDAGGRSLYTVKVCGVVEVRVCAACGRPVTPEKGEEGCREEKSLKS